MRLIVPLVLLLLAAGAGFWWFHDEPVELVDAAGRTLTAGTSASVRAEGSAPDELARARDLREAGDLDATRTELLAVLERSERDGETCLLLSEVAFERRDADEAVEYGEKAVALQPDSAPAHHALADGLALEMMTGGILGAMKTLPRWKATIERTLELDPAHVEAQMALIGYYLFTPGLGDPERALELARTLETSDWTRGKVMQAHALRKLDDPEAAEALCRAALAERPQARELHLALAAFRIQDERIPEADGEYEAAKAGEKDETYYQALYGQAELRREHDFEPERALALCDEYLAAKPRGDWLPSLARAHCLRGALLEQLERPSEARVAYEEALRLQPEMETATEALERLR